MEITVSVKNPTPEFEQELLALLDKHRASLRYNPGWDIPRARTFYEALAPRSQRILRAALAGVDGEVSADELRDNEDASLRGHASAFTRVLKRGATEGWWHSGMLSPIIALGPGSGKVQGYRFRDEDTLRAFTLALGVSAGER
ncbi:hypothetical protein [Streptomyces sp. enrichment culture]|uniref:hypothetical protein n=1 Tax=Streptomyces sp. enrichment culture TaxID=1795815 RepID=UPI003F5701E7